MTQAEKLKNDIAKQEQRNEVAQDDKPKTILDVMMKHKESFEMALPKHLDADRLIRLAVTEFRKNPMLKECTPESLLGAVMQAAQVGLEPDALGSAYLVPYYNKNKNVKEVQLQIGYKGLIELVRRSGQVTSIVANEVYENDEFDFEYGINEKLYHKPTMDADRGKLKCFYAYARFKDGGHAFTVMSVEQINQIRDKFSKSQKNGKHFGPWADHYESMAKKTVIKQLVKYMPISVEIQNQITRDETVHSSFKEEPKPIYAFEESPDIIDAPIEN
ncbi:recombination protein RecT [Bacillus licheniformis]|uniref:recombination protein RecT n=1 Tax=Bacillus licheniformis TaxID=1402 RepID=UPI002281CC12|nr:recombination protein RecT [Bacillus licheniformis]MCY8022041.1 recombination protein RecT [Bacillus licheniformis]MCY9267874.1 recombination protein RecT [Bacillus licheniformis]